MKIVTVILITIPFFSAYAKKSENSVPSSATQYIFDTLVKSSGDLKVPKPPRTTEVKNIKCIVGSGRPYQYNCSATFTIESKEVEKPIVGDNNKFFEYLDAKDGIALDEIKIGATEYRANKITCSYSLDSGNYYKCVSETSVKF